MKTRHATALRRRYGRAEGPADGATEPAGRRVAEAHHRSAANVVAFVTREPDGLYYSWRQGSVYGDADPYYQKPHWHLAFKSKKKALDHMRVLADISE